MSYLLFCFLRFCESGRLVQGVAGDGQEHVQQGVIAAKSQEDEIQAKKERICYSSIKMK